MTTRADIRAACYEAIDESALGDRWQRDYCQTVSPAAVLAILSTLDSKSDTGVSDDHGACADVLRRLSAYIRSVVGDRKSHERDRLLAEAEFLIDSFQFGSGLTRHESAVRQSVDKSDSLVDLDF